MAGRVPMKGNCVDSGPSLVTETLSWLLSYSKRQVTVCRLKILLYCFNQWCSPPFFWGLSLGQSGLGLDLGRS